MKCRAFGQRGVAACATAFAVGLVGLSGNANAQFPQPIPTSMALVKFAGSPPVGRMYKFVSKAPGGGPLFQLPSSSPATTGGSLTVAIGSGTLDCTLAPGLFNGTVGWKELGSPAGSKGYKYLNKNAPTADPCKVVIVKEKAISVNALGTGTIAAPVDYPPGSPDISTVLTLGGEDYCGYAPAPHSRERADRYIKAKDQAAPGSCLGGPATTTTTLQTTSTSTTTAPSTTTTTIAPDCGCCSGGLDLLSFEAGVASGTCGVLSTFRCSNYNSGACADDSDCDFGTCLTYPGIFFCSGNYSVSCTDDSDCTGTCVEVSSGNLPVDLDCGALYVGGGLNSVPIPIALPDQDKFFVWVTSCNGATGEMTLGPTTPAEVGRLHCTQGRRCSASGTPCVRDIDCPGLETCDTQCLFGAPVPAPNLGSPPASYCVINDVADDASGTANCGGSVSNLSIPLRAAFHFTNDLFNSSDPPDIPGVQPCPICDTLCLGGSKDRFPCADDSDCPEGSCGTSPQCLGGPNDSSPCMPETSGTAELGDGFPTSHDCPPDPHKDITTFSGGIPLALSLTTGSMTVNAVDRPGGSRNFFGFCRDIQGMGSGCFEGEPDVGRCVEVIGGFCPDWSPCVEDSDCPGGSCVYFGIPTPLACLDESDCPEDGFYYVCLRSCGCPPSTPPAPESPETCTSDADCADGDEYESCVQRHPGAFSEAGSTRIKVSGNTDGQCLADGEPHATALVSIFPIPPTFDRDDDVTIDLPGPGAVMLQGEVQLQ